MKAIPAVFQSPEQGLRERVVVADPGPAVRRQDTQLFQLCFHRLCLHRGSVIRVQHQRPVETFLSQQATLQQPGSVVAALSLVDFVTHDLAVVYVCKPVLVIELPPHGCIAVGNVTAPHLTRHGGLVSGPLPGPLRRLSMFPLV